MSPGQLIAMRIERKTLARLRRSCGAGLELPDERPKAGGWVLIGAVIACAVIGAVGCFLN